MSKASGIFLIAVGVGVAAYAMPFHNEKGEAPTQEISAGQIVKTDVATTVTSMAMTTPKALPEIEPSTPKPAVKPTPVSAEPKSATPGKSPNVTRFRNLEPQLGTPNDHPVRLRRRPPPSSRPVLTADRRRLGESRRLGT